MRDATYMLVWLHTGVYGEYLSLDGIHSGYNLVLDLN